MDFQYYPTPQHLAKKLWDKFVTPIQCVLDPQAGEGHLVTAYIDYFPDLPDDDEDEDLASLTRENRFLRQAKSRSHQRHVKWGSPRFQCNK